MKTKHIVFLFLFILFGWIFINKVQAHPVSHLKGEGSFTGQVDGEAKNNSAQYAPWVADRLDVPEIYDLHLARDHAYRWLEVTGQNYQHLHGRLSEAVKHCRRNNRCPWNSVDDIGGFMTRDWTKVLEIYWHIVTRNVVSESAAQYWACVVSPSGYREINGQTLPVFPVWYYDGKFPLDTPQKRQDCLDFFHQFSLDFIQAHADIGLEQACLHRGGIFVSSAWFWLNEVNRRAGVATEGLDFARRNLLGFFDSTTLDFYRDECGIQF